MAEFDWATTMNTALETGKAEAVIGLDMEGNVYGAVPINEDGSSAVWLYGGEMAHEAEIEQEDGSMKNEMVDEVNNILLLMSGRKAEIPPGQAVFVNGQKFMALQSLKEQTYDVKPNGEDGDISRVTVDEVYILKGKPRSEDEPKKNAVVAQKGGYVYILIGDSEEPQHQPPMLAEAAALAMYWTVGPDE